MKVLNFFLFVLFASSVSAREGQAPIFLKAENGTGIPDEYVVFLNPDAEPRGILLSLIDIVQAREINVFQNVVKGFTIEVTDRDALLRALDYLDGVTVTENQVITISNNTVQTPVDSWGIDRVDQKTGTNNQYSYVRDGSKVDAYIVDTGIHTSHEDFGGRASFGVDVTGSGEGDNDLNGHGTHVAGKFDQLLLVFIVDYTMISYLPLPFQELLEGLSTG
jgi:subtilisin family serine protease